MEWGMQQEQVGEGICRVEELVLKGMWEGWKGGIEQAEVRGRCVCGSAFVFKFSPVTFKLTPVSPKTIKITANSCLSYLPVLPVHIHRQHHQQAA